MDKQKLFSLTRQAIERYNMIEEGDRIAIGLSGGKDSLTLLTVLSDLQKFYPKKFESVHALSVLNYVKVPFTPNCKTKISTKSPMRTIKTTSSKPLSCL